MQLSARLPVGVGLGWRPETALLVEERRSLAFTEVIAETIDPTRPPTALRSLIERGLPVVTHGVSLSLGGAARVDEARLARLAAVATALRSPLVSEHVAFSRHDELEAPHFLPVPMTRTQLAVLVDNVRRASAALPVPLALENIAAPVVWPGAELAEAELLAELLERTGARLLLDVANLHANLVNHGGDLDAYLARLPLERVAYLHVAGGAHVDGTWRDTHAHAVSPAIAATLDCVLDRIGPVPVLLERDHGFSSRAELTRELDALESQVVAAPPRRPAPAGRRAPLPLPTLPPAEWAQLARAQRTLIETVLAADGPILEGFDARHIAEARAIVAQKRRRPCAHMRRRRSAG